MVSTPENEQQQQEDIQTEDATRFDLINRVIAYPTVSNMWESAKGIYTNAKDKSYYVKKGCEMVESNVDNTMKYIVQPVLENETVKKISEPLLTTVDDFGCKQLDKLEKLSETYQPTVVAIKDNLVNKGTALVQTLPQTIENTDQYLKNNYLATPLNIAVEVTENIVDRYLPEQAKEQGAPSQSPGPIVRGGKLAVRMQKEAFAKLSNLNLRNVETLSNFHVVDLIQYAATNFDSGVEATKKTVGDSIHKGVDFTKETVKSVTDSPRVKQTTEQVQHYTQDAVQALVAAVELISKQIPEPLTSTSQAVLKQYKNFAVTIEDANVAFYSLLATTSAQKLRETSALISSSVHNASEKIPSHLLESAKSTLLSIIDSFVGARNQVQATNSTTTVTPTSVSAH